MKKFFTLISMAFVAMSVSAQDAVGTELPENYYPAKNIVWAQITWKQGNNKKDKENKDMLFLMGTGNGQAKVYAEAFWSEDKGADVIRPAYTYIDYEKDETGLPEYGLYYKFTPKKDGLLKVNVWVNKGNRKTFVVKASDGKPLAQFTDYTFDGYVNGQNTNTDEPVIDPDTQEQKIDNGGNPVWVQHPTYFTADEIKARVDAENKAKEEQATTEGKTFTPINPYVIDLGNQPVWGWITLNVKAGESYVIYQQTSQIGFGGYEFEGENYGAVHGTPEAPVLAAEFAAVVDAETGAVKDEALSDKGSVVTFGTASMDVEAVGSSVPESLEAEGYVSPSAIAAIKTINAENAAMFNLAGQKVQNGFKGMVIMNGKKMMMK